MRRRAPVGQLRTEVRQPAGHRIVQAELAALHQAMAAADTMGLVSEEKRKIRSALICVRVSRFASPAARRMHDLAVMGNEDDRAHEAFFRHRRIDDGIHPAKCRSARFQHS